MKQCACCHGSAFELVKSQQNGWQIVRCCSCGLVQVCPKPSKQEINLLYQNDWEHFTPYVSQTDAHRKYFETLLSFLLKLLPKNKPFRMLDVGSATGVFLSVLKKHHIAGVGVDVSLDAVSFCKKQGLEAYQGTLSMVARQKKWRGRFDAIVACQIIEHESDPFTFFTTVKKLLKPNGIVVLTTPNHDVWWRMLMGGKWIGYRHPEHLFFFTPDTLSLLMGKAGLSVFLVRKDFSRQYSVSYAFSRLSDYMPMFSPIFQWFARHTQSLHLSTPFNPWGDFLIVGKT